MKLTLVLSVGLDEELLNTRYLILQSAGYTVVQAQSLNAALDCFASFDFDLVLLCQSFHAYEKELLTAWIRASGSHIPVVSISEKPWELDEFAYATVGNDPEDLLMGMREVLIKAANSAEWKATFRDRTVIAAVQGKKPPQLSAGYELPKKTAKGFFSPLARAG